MANVTALGLSKIEVADIDATTGLHSGSYATLGKTYGKKPSGTFQRALLLKFFFVEIFIELIEFT